MEESFALPAHYVDENTEFIQKVEGSLYGGDRANRPIV